MDNGIKNTVNIDTNTETKPKVGSKPDTARVKRMRGWLGVKGNFSGGGFGGDGGEVSYGDGHSGWNR